MTKSHNSCKTCNIAKSNLHVMLVTVCGYEQNLSRGVGGVAHTRFPPIWYIVKQMTKSHNSSKTCNIAKLLRSSSCHVGHCVWVWTSRGVGRVAHTRYRDVRTDIRTDIRTENLNAMHPQVCGGHKNCDLIKVFFLEINSSGHLDLQICFGCDNRTCT